MGHDDLTRPVLYWNLDRLAAVSGERRAAEAEEAGHDGRNGRCFQFS
jgi:hypothetical protein